MTEIHRRPLRHIDTLGTFPYGRATATTLYSDEAKGKRSTRVNADRVGEIFQALHHPGLPTVAETDLPSAIAHDNGNAFSRISLGGVGYYVMARGPVDGRRLPDMLDSSESPPSISVVTGMCLFSGDSAWAVSRTGERFPLTDPEGPRISKEVTSLDVRDSLTTYETEATVRLATFINSFAKGAPVDSLFIKIPQPEYYTYALDAYTNGLLPPEPMLEWMDAVDERHDRLFTQFQRRALRGVGREVEVVNINPLAPVGEYMKGHIKNGSQPSLAEAVGILEGDTRWALWKDVLKVEPPESWSDLNRLAYVLDELEVASLNMSNQPHLAVAIKSPTESKIFAHAKRLITKTPLPAQSGREFSLIALYPHENLVQTGENVTRIPYYVPHTDGYSAARDVFSAYSPRG